MGKKNKEAQPKALIAEHEVAMNNQDIYV